MQKSVTVRMYNVGFGDAFLVSVPTDEGLRRVLVDCGSIKAGAHAMPDVVKQIVADCTPVSGQPRIDVVIATHRHKDHVSGFQQRKQWDEVEVGEVWMPWTEDPTDHEARRIRETQSGLAMALQSALAARTLSSRFTHVVENALTNEAAMSTLHDGFRGKPRRRYLSTDAGPKRIDTDQLPGVDVFVLGPSRKEAVIRDMDPPSGKSYVRSHPPVPAGLRVGGAQDAAPRPFGAAWAAVPPPFPLSDRDARRIREAADDAEAAAAALDKAVNGTSLMLVMRVGDAHLLLPGDAQWGTWRAALDDTASRALLSSTTFLKVGHHGSHNATPKEFVADVLTSGGEKRAMASCTHVADWPNIPREPLLTALRAKARVARSDQIATADPNSFRANGDLYLDTSLTI